MPYKLDNDIIKRIVDENNIVDVIEEYLPLKKTGANYSTNCPFHKEKTPSFIVSPDKQMYHCFGCGESGDSISFVSKYRNFSFVEAAEYLARRAGITLEEVGANQKEKKDNLLSEKLYKINKEAAVYYYKNLKMYPSVVSYLNSRKIDVNVIKMFGIGYAINEWDNLLKYLLKKGYSEEEIIKTGLIIKHETKNSYYDRFRNRVIFPILDTRNRIIGFGGRVLDDSLPKYLNSPEGLVFSKGNNLYGINLAKNYVKEKSFIIVEGYMDVIKMHVNGYNTAVASLGTALTENQIKLMKRYSKNFYLSLDSDTAGQTATLKAFNLFKKLNLDAKVVIITNAKDPDEYLNKYGKSSFDKLLENALDYYSYLEFYYKNIFENSNKVDYINKFFDNIINVNSEIEKELIFEKLSNKIGISKDSIIKEFNKRQKKGKFIEKPQVALAKLKVNKPSTSHEMEIIKIILADNNYALKLIKILEEREFEEFEYYEIFKKIYEHKINNTAIDVKALSEILRKELDEDVINIEDLKLDDLDSFFNDCLIRLKLKYYENKKNSLTNSINQSENSQDINLTMDKIYNLAKKIKSTKEELN